LLLEAIALPWFVLVQLKYSGFFDYIIIKQHFARYTASTFNSVYPWWFYLMALGIFFPRGVLSLLPAATGPIKTWAALCRIWLLSVLLFFSLPSSKLLGYILPAVPPQVMLAAMGWDTRSR
jgi:4-amino-4-deoxy-L-arabinose transferase-like glycosyltransferase